MWIQQGEARTCDARVSDAYERHAAELIRFASQRLRDRDDAEDVLHEAFLRLAEETGEGRFPEQPRAWLYRVVHNVIVSRARHAAVARRYAALDRIETVEADSAPGRTIAAEDWQLVHRALGHVAPAAQTALRLAATGYSGREIAVHLGKTEPAVRTMLSRARADIRREVLASVPVAA
jgi:RNA polymerase sigma-70 factor (ECF subfamily)